MPSAPSHIGRHWPSVRKQFARQCEGDPMNEMDKFCCEFCEWGSIWEIISKGFNVELQSMEIGVVFFFCET